MVRISIPHNEDFMIILNAEKKIDQFYSELLEKCKHGFDQNKDEVLRWCEKKLSSTKISSQKLLWDYYSSKPEIKELKEEFGNCFENKDNLGNDIPHELIHHAAMGTIEGLPIVRYEHESDKANRILITGDEFEFFIESTIMQKSRADVEKFFGNVEYTLSVYEKLVEISIPIKFSTNDNNQKKDQTEKNFLLTMIINNKMNDEELNSYEKKIVCETFFPEPITKIFNFIEKLDWSEIISGD